MVLQLKKEDHVWY